MWAPPAFTLLWPGGTVTPPPDQARLAGSTLHCLTHANPPFVIVTPDASAPGGHAVSGLSIDVFATIAAKIGFSVRYTVYTSTYDSMVRLVGSGDYDCAVADVTTTSARMQVAVFTSPYYVDTVQLAVRSPLVASAGLFSFLSPFSATLWITYLLLAVACGVLLFIFERGHNEELSYVSRGSQWQMFVVCLWMALLGFFQVRVARF